MAKKQKKSIKNKKNIIVLVLVAIVFGISYRIYRYGYSLVNPDLIKARWTNERVVDQMGLFGYFLYDVNSIITSNLNSVSQQEINEVKTHIANFKRNNTNFIKQTKKKNVILLQLESMDGILLNNTYKDQEITPNLNAFAKECIYFPNTFDVTGNGRTSDGELTSLTSLLPIQNEVAYEKFDLSNVYGLPKILADNGYKTISVHGYKREFWNRMITHPALGYQKSYFMSDLNNDEMIGWGISDKSVAKQAVDIFDNQEGLTYMHVILLTNHHPYTYAPPKFIENPSGVEESYFNSANYQDEAVGVFIDELKSRGLLDNTILMIFGDHDSAITRKIYPLLGYSFDEETYRNDHVPMMMYTGLENKVDETYRGQTDISPLILENLGIAIPDTMLGNGNFYAEKGVLKQNGKLIYNQNGIAMQADSKVKPLTYTKVVINKGLDVLK